MLFWCSPDPVITTRKSQARDENVVGIVEPGLVAPCWHLFQLHLQADQASIQLIAPRHGLQEEDEGTHSIVRLVCYSVDIEEGSESRVWLVYPTIEEVLSYISFGWYIWLVYPTNWYILQILIWLVYPTIEEVLTAYSRE